MVIGPAGDFSESPPGGGPVAALAAALPRLTAPVVVVLAADLPFVTMSTVERLVTCAPAVAVDDDGRPQFLLGAYLVAELRQAMPAAAAGTSMRGLVSSLATPPAWISVGVPGGPPPWFDCDTPAQLDAARSWQ
jgi:molybdopterin-guanine dinucleotide biosynthesis protein A